MNSSRRGFLKVMAATPVAAPAMMKSTAEALSIGSLNAPIAAYGFGGSVSSDQVPEDWMKKEVKNLLARKKRVETRAENEIRNEHVRFACEVDALRSVSAVSRVRIAQSRIAAHERSRELSYIDQELERMKEKLGISWLEGMLE